MVLNDKQIRGIVTKKIKDYLGSEYNEVYLKRNELGHPDLIYTANFLKKCSYEECAKIVYEALKEYMPLVLYSGDVHIKEGKFYSEEGEVIEIAYLPPGMPEKQWYILPYDRYQIGKKSGSKQKRSLPEARRRTPFPEETTTLKRLLNTQAKWGQAIFTLTSAKRGTIRFSLESMAKSSI